MALLDSEIVAIKRELGYNLLTLGAVPYIGITQLFDQVIQPYLTGGASTTSTTAVTSATTATPASLLLASATGFEAGARVVVDVDDREEAATVQSISGSTITVLLKLTHSGTYPVRVEGPESMVRDMLRSIRAVHTQIAAAAGTAGLKRVDVIEWYGTSVATSQTATLNRMLMDYRDQLASMLGVPNGWRLKQSASQTMSNY